MVELFVTLTTERKAELMDSCAVHHAKLEALNAKKDREAKIINGEIKAEEEAINSILRVVRGKGENKDQKELFADEGRVTEDAAKAALAALQARQPACSEIDARECAIHGRCTCEPALRKCGTCFFAIPETPGAAAYMCPNCPDTTLVQVLPEGPAPSVKAVDCTLHGVDAPHAKEPAAAPELTEPQIVEKLAAEAVAEWARLKKTPESVKERNARVKEAIAAQSIPVHRRKPFGQAVARLLADGAGVPANHGASDAPVEEVDGNVSEEAGA